MLLGTNVCAYPINLAASTHNNTIAVVLKLAPAPLDAVNIFFGGDVWHSLTRLVGGTPIKKASARKPTPF
jgi:hypothetical protein